MINLIDTSAAISASKNGARISGYATPGIMEEIERHYNIYRGKQREITSDVYKGIKPITCENDDIRYDAYWTWLASATEKKRTRDPISKPDLEVIAAALHMAKKDYSVNVMTEDAHISNTIHEMLKLPEYRVLENRIKILKCNA
ncbi:MAG: hypothetical protein QXP39_01550 [Candidatus Aenigmatarchaeota archaeon]